MEASHITQANQAKQKDEIFQLTMIILMEQLMALVMILVQVELAMVKPGDDADAVQEIAVAGH